MNEDLRNNSPKNIKCPFCNKEIPEEIQFCPYCMQRLTQPKIIENPKIKRVKSKPIVIILLIICLLITSIFSVLKINEYDKKKGADTTDKTQTTSSVTKNRTTPTTQQVTDKTPNTESSIIQNTQSNTLTVTEMVNRWNKADANLNFSNYALSDYAATENDETYTIHQTFNSCGANIDFIFRKDLGSYTLKIGNIQNLNTMYQLLRISLCAVSNNDYNDTEFYQFLTNDDWERSNAETTVKNGVFGEYKCTVSLTEKEQTDQWGLSYTRYICTFTASKI